MSQEYEKLNHLAETLREYIYCDSVPLQDWRISDQLGHDTPVPAASDPAWRTIQPGEPWGSSMSWAWLQANFTIPMQYADQPAALHIEFDVDIGGVGSMLWSAPEALLTVQGLDTQPQAFNEFHPEALLSESVTPGNLQITLHAFTGLSLPAGHQVRLKTAELVRIERDVDALYWDAHVLLDTIAVLPEDVPERSHYLRTLNHAFQHIHWLNPLDASFMSSVRQARAILQEQIFEQVTPSSIPRPVVHALGHAHLDLAWLWPLRVTRGKAQRTFATALALMDQFPDYTFTQSQPYLYQVVAEDDPVLFAQIRSRIASGQWNATGATWVEMDANLPSGESLVRQFLYGMRYFEHELGTRPEVLFLPDGFGFNAALPQMMQQAGIRYFFTNKLSWNDHTRQPFDTFWWEGLDGSRVLAHLGTTPETLWNVGRSRDYTTYVALMTPEEIRGTWARYRQKAANQHLMIPYGMGDGGGGPNRDTLEKRSRMADLPPLSRVIHSTLEQFFHALEDDLTAELPRWVGELYLQYHRGTYTSQARIKRYNRQLEALLHDAEALAAISLLLGADYPQAELESIWKILLLNQFHDILPGSSIREVHVQAESDYRHAYESVSELIDLALSYLATHIHYDSAQPAFAVFNTLSVNAGGPIELTLLGDGPVVIVDAAGQIVPHQWLDEANRRALFFPHDLPSYGYAVYRVLPDVEQSMPADAVQVSQILLDNGLIRAEFDGNGHLIRLFDHEYHRELLADNEMGNQLWTYVDRPHEFDAWEVAVYLHDQGWRLHPESVQVLETGPLRAALEIRYRFNASQIFQRISLAAGERLLRFETEVDWHERQIILQVHFPLAIRSVQATCEIQFGTIERPTHRNTAWDQAQHEVPAQQWVDLSEADYGVSLLNDCKYGYRMDDNILSLSLLKSSRHPDPEADQGSHQFTYALYPHAGDWRQGTIAQARRLKQPLRSIWLDGRRQPLPARWGLVECDTPGVVVDTVKKAEDSNDLIVRIYEAHGGRNTAVLRFASHIEAAAAVNLLEEPAGSVDTDGHTLSVSLTPYQIRSFRVRLAAFN